MAVTQYSFFLIFKKLSVFVVGINAVINIFLTNNNNVYSNNTFKQYLLKIKYLVMPCCVLHIKNYNRIKSKPNNKVIKLY